MICTVYEKSEGSMGDRGEYIRWGEGNTPSACLVDARTKEAAYVRAYAKAHAPRNAFLDHHGTPMRNSEFILIPQ